VCEIKVAADEEQDASLRAVCAVLARYGEAVAGGAGAESVAYEWLAEGFADAEEVEEWLGARCFRAQHAAALERAGFTPAQAALRTTAGRGEYEDTIAYKFAQGDLTLAEARRLVTSDFWHS
jgi:hypothetical protein